MDRPWLVQQDNECAGGRRRIRFACANRDLRVTPSKQLPCVDNRSAYAVDPRLFKRSAASPQLPRFADRLYTSADDLTSAARAPSFFFSHRLASSSSRSRFRLASRATCAITRAAAVGLVCVSVVSEGVCWCCAADDMQTIRASSSCRRRPHRHR